MSRIGKNPVPIPGGVDVSMSADEITVKGLGENYPFGFPLYAVGQTADILAFRPVAVPVGEDQLAHIEPCREVARRFNKMYCGVPDKAPDEEHVQLGGVFPIPIADVGKVLGTTEMNVRVEGYADGLGEEEANWRLSADRSLAVVHALRERASLKGDRLESVAFGPHHPGASVGEDRSWNRRIELVLRADQNRGVGKALTILEEGKSDGG